MIIEIALGGRFYFYFLPDAWGLSGRFWLRFFIEFKGEGILEALARGSNITSSL